ncbi:hypothetical protein [Streptomyces sp. NPDC048341]|uniref:hypothetical protein n=1 Tax=Streptomyces sp. NPDC048341 TaxID=3154620 RepID=UPI003420025B
MPRPGRSGSKRHPWALTAAEEVKVLVVLRSSEFVDAAPAGSVVLLDRGVHLCSEVTLYQILRKHGEVRERRRQVTHPPRRKPELIATAPDRVWSCRIAPYPPCRGSGRALYACPERAPS